MITELSIFNVYGDSMSFPIPSGGDGYLIKDIKGLDPVPVSLVSTPQANLPGERFQASKREKRNIVLTIEIQKGYAGVSVEDRRRALYSLMIPETPLTLFFETTHFGQVSIEGYVDTFEAPIFGNDSTKATISIVCFRPEFVGEKVVVTYPDNNVWSKLVVYEGTVPTGIVAHSSVPSTGTAWAFRCSTDYDVALSNSAWFYLSTSGTSTTEITLSSVPGDKFVHNQAGESLLHRQSEASIWPILHPGDNYAFPTSSPTPVVSSNNWMSYNPLYGAL